MKTHTLTIAAIVAISSVLGGCEAKKAPQPQAAATGDPAVAAEKPAPAPGAKPEPKATVRRWDFENEPTGNTPKGFTVAKGKWSLAADPTSGDSGTVLGQLGKSGRPEYNVILVDGTSYRDLDLSVRVKAETGKIDQGGGLVWRARDARNYYISRYNPLEDNFRVYRVVDGKRRQLGSADVRVDHAAWHALRVTMNGNRIECYLDGKKYLEVADDTFPETGQIGLWTKADARSHFDDLVVTSPAGAAIDASEIERIVGAKPQTTADGVVKVTWARDAVPVAIDGVSFPPSAGLTTWAGFQSVPVGAMVMGDTVVFQDEVDAAMDAAFAHGLQITALHNHFFFDEPKVYFMHIGGHGEVASLARGVKATWDAVRAVRKASPTPATTFAGQTPVAGSLNAKAIGEAIGLAASTKPGGVVKVTVGRDAVMHGTAFGGSMGLTTWAAFTGTDALAAMGGDFAMTASEVQPVLRALRKANIHVVALHNHMVGEEPVYYFTHFWAKGSAVELARGFRSVLDAQRSASHGQGH